MTSIFDPDHEPDDDEIIIIPEEDLALASPVEREAYLQYLVEETKKRDEWESWIKLFFPHFAKKEFSEGHREFWEWVWSIKAEGKVPTWVSIWPRGHAKSTSAEMAVAALAARGMRKYVLYVGETQEQADDHVANIAAMLEGSMIELGYPLLGTPAVTKAGNTKGWRRNRIISASGFVLDACGLDSAARGVKFEDQRPDAFVFDDIDGELDTEATTARKVTIITKKLLPAGSSECIFLFVQNLVHEKSIFAQLASTGQEGQPEPAEFLTDRIVSGPIPAVRDLEVKQVEDEETGRFRFKIVGGTPTWPAGFGLEKCEEQINEFGLSSFLSECQHETQPPEGGVFSHLEFRHITSELLPQDPKTGEPKFKRVVVWVDPAVSANDASDCMGIQCDALGYDGLIYRLWSWEQKSTPFVAMKQAIRIALQWNADIVGVETNQGGDTWRVVYDQALLDTRREIEAEGGDFFRKMPRYKEKKATKELGSKINRAERMLVDYERGKFLHLIGTHMTLEKSLKRFPKMKPYDLVDASYWSWNELTGILHRRKSKANSSGRRALGQAIGVANAPRGV